ATAALQKAITKFGHTPGGGTLEFSWTAKGSNPQRQKRRLKTIARLAVSQSKNLSAPRPMMASRELAETPPRGASREPAGTGGNRRPFYISTLKIYAFVQG
ncbi:MAG: hypothetical protein RRY97_08605, partial [Oscillibacter sp.]